MIDLSGVAQVSGKTRCGIRATPNKSLVTTFNKHFSGRRVRGSPQQPVQGEVQAVRGRGQQLQPLRLQQLDLHRLGQPQVESKLKSRPPSAVIAASSAPSPGGGWDDRAPDLKHERGEQLRRRVRPTLILRRKPVRWGTWDK